MGFQTVTVMLVTSLFWWLNDGDHFKMLVTKKYVGDIFQHVVLIRKPNKLWETLMHSGSYFDKLEFLQTVSANFVPASNLACYSKLWRWFQEYWLPMIKWLLYRCIWIALNHLLAGYLRFHNDPFIWMKTTGTLTGNRQENIGDIDVGDGCWRQNSLVTSSRCGWPI